MQKMKKLVITLLVVVLFSACGEYQKVLNKGKNAERYKLAVELYEKKEYKKEVNWNRKKIMPHSQTVLQK